MKWSSSNVKSSSSIALSSDETFFSGKSSLKLDYNFQTGESGTSVAYLDAKSSIAISGNPDHLGLRVFGDGKQQWLRGKVIDGKGTAHTINFTEEKGLGWSGWNYVTANLSSDWPAPLKLDQIYVAQTYDDLKSKGTLYFDDLQAVYNTDHKEPLFNDTYLPFWAETEVGTLVNQGIISGYPNGSFKPNQPLTRVQAAILLSRALNLNVDNVQDPHFTDVPTSYRFYANVAAAYNAGVIKGKEGGTIFDLNTELTRAEMAVIMQRAYKLSNGDHNYFKDNVPSSFAYDAVNAMAANAITLGYNDGSFRPAKSLTRTEFSIFLYRAMK